MSEPAKESGKDAGKEAVKKPARKATPMKLKLPAGELAACLQKVTGAARNNPVIEIMRNVLLEAKDGQMKMTAVNQDMQITVVCEAKHENPFQLTLSAEKLFNITRYLPADEDVQLVWEKGKSRVDLKSGGASFLLSMLPADEFPLMKAIKESKEKMRRTINAPQLLAALRRVQYASAQQSHRMCLNGILLELTSEGLTLVATDGHRMAIEKVDAEGESGKGDSERQYILPRRSVQELVRNLGDDEKLELSATDRAAKFETPSFTLISNLIDESYPDYRSVVPLNNDKKLTMERRPLLEALQRVTAICETNVTLIFEIRKDEIAMEAVNRDDDISKDLFATSYAGEPVKIGFNGGFLKDMLGAAEDDVVEMSFLNNSDSVLFRPAQEDRPFRYIVMPIRL